MIYACLVPCMPSPKSADGRSHTLESLINENVDGIITPVPILPIVPPTPYDRTEENRDLIRIFVTTVLETMVGHACSIKWKDAELEKRSFPFMWDMWKKYYVQMLFTDLDLNTDLYNPILQLNLQAPSPYDYVKFIDDSGSVDSSITTREDLLPARIAFIQWLVEYSIDTLDEGSKKKSKSEKMATVAEDDEPPHAEEDSSSMNVTPSESDRHSTVSSSHSEEERRQQGILVRRAIYSNRANVNLIHEVFRQAFLLPFIKIDKCHEKEKPISPAGVVIKAFSMWLNPNEEERRCALPIWCEEPKFDDTPEDDVRAGMQSTLQAFIIHSSYVFLLNPNHEMIEMHACTCKDVLNQYRSIIMYLEMDDNTWNQLLIILVHITRALLRGEQQNGSLASNVTSPLIQTLIVAWIKASLYAAVSTELWNDMLQLSHEMTHLALMITEWAKTMKVLSNMLVQQVYNLDPEAFPLDKPTEKTRRIKGRKAAKPAESDPAPVRTFSEDQGLKIGSFISSPIAAPGETGTINESEFENSTDPHGRSNQSENGISATWADKQSLSGRIKRAYSDADLFVGKEPLKDDGSYSLRSRTQSETSGPLPKNQSNDSFKPNDLEIDQLKIDQSDLQSETASLSHDWNPALINHEPNFNQDDSLEDQSMAQSPDRDDLRHAYTFDTNSVILRNDKMTDKLPGKMTDHMTARRVSTIYAKLIRQSCRAFLKNPPGNPVLILK